MHFYLTRDRSKRGLSSHIDVWCREPSRRVTDEGCVWWRDYGSGHLGEYKVEIVARVFGVAPSTDSAYIKVHASVDALVNCRN